MKHTARCRCGRFVRRGAWCCCAEQGDLVWLAALRERIDARLRVLVPGGAYREKEG